MKNESRVGYAQPEDAYATLSPINTLLKLFSLTTLGREHNHLKIKYIWPLRIIIIAALVLTTVTFSVLKVLKYYHHFVDDENFTIKFTDSLQLNYLIEFIQYIVDLTYVFRFGGHTSLKYFKVFTQIDETLGMKYNRIIKRKILKLTVCVCLFSILSAVLDFRAWSALIGYNEHAVYTIEYILFFINTLTIIDMCANVIQIEYRLKTMVDLLQDMHASADNTIGVVDVVGDKSWLYFSKDKKITRKLLSQSKLDYNNTQELIWLNKCYLFLTEQNNYINEAFGARILLNNASQLYNLVNFINLAIRIVTGVIFSEGAPDKIFFLSFTCLLKTICSAINVACIVYRCEKSYEQREVIISIVDHILVDKDISESMTNSLTDFRDLVESRPIEFTAMNFYRLDSSLLVSFASVVTTLTIIMLQS